jgi:hypothetical protein
LGSHLGSHWNLTNDDIIARENLNSQKLLHLINVCEAHNWLKLSKSSKFSKKNWSSQYFFFKFFYKSHGIAYVLEGYKCFRAIRIIYIVS